ncbi:hypothetical protein [Halobellus sp. EA9]|uniref:hypothetical protein n=1 Tax=Halobellus sp. EA9 TaxID=3421647 RepID=UPI003EBD76EF
MTGLDDYIGDGENQQKQTHITLSNPDHPESEAGYAEEERMKKHFRAAKSLKNSPIDRKKIVGDFLVAVDKEVVQNKEGAIEEFLEASSG